MFARNLATRSYRDVGLMARGEAVCFQKPPDSARFRRECPLLLQHIRPWHKAFHELVRLIDHGVHLTAPTSIVQDQEGPEELEGVRYRYLSLDT
jgi:hypothetical protein